MPFLVRGMQLSKFLQLDVDPDESPNQFTVIEAQERRRTFWLMNYGSILYQSCGVKVPSCFAKDHNVKEPEQVEGTLFTNTITIAPMCNILQLVVSIRQHHEIIPTSVQSLLASPKGLELNAHLMSIHSQIPSPIILNPNPLDPSRTHDVMISQLLSVDLGDSKSIPLQ
jgi:hypothetical protein